MQRTSRSPSELRYTLQFGRGRFWRTRKTWNAETEDYRVLSHMLRLIARQAPRYHWRIVLMPFNVIAETTEP